MEYPTLLNTADGSDGVGRAFAGVVPTWTLTMSVPGGWKYAVRLGQAYLATAEVLITKNENLVTKTCDNPTFSNGGIAMVCQQCMIKSGSKCIICGECSGAKSTFVADSVSLITVA